MKTNVVLFLMLVFAGFVGQSTARAQTVSELTGIWRCEASAAPPGYTQSIMEIKQDSVIVTFTGDSFPYSSTLVKFDSISLVFIINELDATCEFRVENSKSMTGKAIWPEGETPLTLTRIEDL